MDLVEIKYRADLLMSSVHEKNLLIFKKVPKENNYHQMDISELRVDDIVFFRHPETLNVLTNSVGNRFYKILSTPFLKSEILTIEIESIELALVDNTTPVQVLESDTVIGKCYLRIV